MQGKPDRYEHLVNLILARLSTVLMRATGVLIGLTAFGARRVMVIDQRTTANPNPGWRMAAIPDLLGRRPKKLDYYDLGAEFPRPEAEDIALRHWIAA